MVKGYVVHTQDPGGAVAYLDNLKTWHHVLKDTLFGVQEVLGDLAAVGDACHKIAHAPVLSLHHRYIGAGSSGIATYG